MIDQSMSLYFFLSHWKTFMACIYLQAKFNYFMLFEALFSYKL